LSNGGGETEDLFELISDGGSDFLDLVDNAFSFSHGKGEFSDFDEHVSEQSGDLFHEGFGANKGVERFGPFLDGFLFLVESL